MIVKPVGSSRWSWTPMSNQGHHDTLLGGTEGHWLKEGLKDPPNSTGYRASSLYQATSQSEHIVSNAWEVFNMHLTFPLKPIWHCWQLHFTDKETEQQRYKQRRLLTQPCHFSPPRFPQGHPVSHPRQRRAPRHW
jgi:hypothetical protein